MNILINPKERTRFLRFAVVGAVGAVVDFGLFNLLVGLTHINPVVASVISFIAAVVSNFTWNRLWTYPDSRSKSLASQLTQFFIINIIGLAIRTPVFAGTEQLYESGINAIQVIKDLIPSGLTVTFLSHNLALATAVGLVMLWNFFANRYWTYNDVK